MSLFSKVPITPPDPILNLGRLFREDQNPNKVALGVGAYLDENGKPFILPSVRAAEKIISADLDKFNKEYPPQPGFALFIKAAQEFLLGENHPALKQNRVATCQSISGTGSLHVGFCMTHKFLSQCQMYFPSTTWPNHYDLYSKVYSNPHKDYQYLAPNTLKIDWAKTKADMLAAPDNSIFLLHACAHNPTGVDFSKQQWTEMADVFKQKKHVAFFDVAYQGFASGSFEEDGFAVRLFAEKRIDCVVAQSFSKNFGLYGERIGACHVIHGDTDSQVTVNNQAAMCQIVRATWSMSPIHGAYIVQTIGNDAELKKQFLLDVQGMAGRVKKMRQALYDALLRLKTPGDWSHFVTCIGMFTYSGLTVKQVQYIRQKFSIYILENGGRMTMCGLTDKSIDYVAEAIHDAVLNCKE